MPSTKRLRVTALATGALLLAAGCGSGGGSGDPNHLKLYNDKGAWKPYFEQMAEFGEQRIGIDMEPVGYTDEPAYTAFIKSSFRTNVKPDLFTWTTGERLREIVEQDQVAETGDIWAQGIKSGDLTEQLRQYYTIDGKQYCVPLNTAYWGMFYSKKVFEKHDLEPPETWDELMDVAAKLKAAGQVPFHQTTPTSLFSFVWFEQLLAGTDPELYDRLSKGEASYTDPGVVKVMEQWKGLIDKGYLTEPGDKADPADHFKSGDAAMVMNGTWFNTSMTQRGLELGKDYGFFLIPNVNADLPKRSLIFESGPLCSLKKAPSPESSEKYLTWWTSAEAQEKWANARGDVSANPKVKIADPDLGEVAKKATSDENRLVLRYFEATPSPVLTEALSALDKFLNEPGSYMEVLQTIQKANDRYWKQQKAGS
ncbi:ABC transporter substrate-binding protein [Actinomadura rifamycini]|uniref:ABC transporter substrate-binding protein n=1 Tax=Actinomadura rifamycini TaxID=31962 RepID=UPI0003F8583B|nr:extracellular solute-binding protein [Actinomadura rifamycini]